jgi:hypothetical protein
MKYNADLFTRIGLDFTNRKKRNFQAESHFLFTVLHAMTFCQRYSIAVGVLVIILIVTTQAYLFVHPLDWEA